MDRVFAGLNAFMFPFRPICCVLLAFLTLAGCSKPATPPPPAVEQSGPTHAQPKLPTIQLWLGPEQMTAEMALTREQEETGMMFRTNMEENAGMIFVFPFPQRANFWMKNCPLPLSAAYIDSEGVILELHEFRPNDTNTISSATENIHFVLETPQGWFNRHNIHEGVKIRTEKGSLMQTFGLQR